jgi:hypothetical protein
MGELQIALIFRHRSIFCTRVRMASKQPCRFACLGARELAWLAAAIEGWSACLRRVPERTDAQTAREPFTWAFWTIMTMGWAPRASRGRVGLLAGRTDGRTAHPRFSHESGRSLPRSSFQLGRTGVGVIKGLTERAPSGALSACCVRRNFRDSRWRLRDKQQSSRLFSTWQPMPQRRGQNSALSVNRARQSWRRDCDAMGR